MPPADSCADKADTQSYPPSESVAMRVGAQTDRGLLRSENEDAYWAQPPWFAVADGMGGHSAGEVASRIAVETVREWAERGHQGTAKELVAAIEEANRRIWQMSQREAHFTGMGTTLTVAHIAFPRCLVAHVGDSRCYRFRGGKLHQLTSDHSVVAELVRTGTLTEEEAASHPQRNLLTRALGMAPEVDVDVIQEHLMAGDVVVLCTDGLTGVVAAAEIESILTETASLDEAAERLVSEANAKGGPDNITVLLVAIPAHPETE